MYIKLILPIFLALFISCNSDEEEIGKLVINCNDTLYVSTNTILQLKEMHKWEMVSFENDVVIEGYVASSDASGNFYKTLSIQDSYENPTAAIRVAIDANFLYSKFNVGRKVFLKLKGLAMDKKNGVLEIGKPLGTTLERIPEPEIDNHIIRTCETQEMIPKLIDFSKIKDENLEILISLENIQFEEKDLDKTYANATNSYSVNRKLIGYDENCNETGTIYLRNSGFSSFKQHGIPSGKGSITAILSKYNNTYQIFIRNTNDIIFESNRCPENK